MRQALCILFTADTSILTWAVYFPLFGWTLDPQRLSPHGNRPPPCFPPALSVQVANTWPSGQALCHNLQVRLGLHPSSPRSVAPAPDPLPSPGNASADIPSALSPSILMPGPHLVLSACFLTSPLPSLSKSCHLSPQHGGHRWFSV